MHSPILGCKPSQNRSRKGCRPGRFPAKNPKAARREAARAFALIGQQHGAGDPGVIIDRTPISAELGRLEHATILAQAQTQPQNVVAWDGPSLLRRSR